MSDVPRNISIFDLKKVPGAVGIIQRNNKKEVETLLHQYGFDVSCGYEFEECWHRPLTQKGNEAIFGVRVVGTERVDPSWLASGNASWEARVFAINDPEMRSDLQEMGRTGSSDRTFIDESVGKKVAQQEKKKVIKEDK